MTVTKHKISIVIPLWNEQAVFQELAVRLQTVIASQNQYFWEVLFIDDGSCDATWALICDLSRQTRSVRGLRLARNFGHQAALSAALDHVTGDVVIMMDGDLQDEPEHIPLFLAKYAEGNDVVYAIRSSRDASWFLNLAYLAFYRLLSHLSEISLPLDAGDFSLLSRRAVELLKNMPERHRFLRGMRAWIGLPSTEIHLTRPERAAGTSKYSVRRLFRLAFDGVFAFSVKPLRWTFIFGAIFVFVALSFAVYAIIAQLFWNLSPSGFTAIVTLISLCFGVQFVFIGVIGEYVGRIFEQVKMRPIYVVEDRCGD